MDIELSGKKFATISKGGKYYIRYVLPDGAQADVANSYCRAFNEKIRELDPGQAAGDLSMGVIISSSTNAYYLQSNQDFPDVPHANIRKAVYETIFKVEKSKAEQVLKQQKDDPYATLPGGGL